MKITFLFDSEVEDDIIKAERCMKVDSALNALYQIKSFLREKVKYTDEKNYDTMQKKFFEILSDNDIDLEKLW